MKTLDELEREAYIKGDVELANLYAELIDSVDEIETLEGWDGLKTDDFEDKIEYWRHRALIAEKQIKHMLNES